MKRVIGILAHADAGKTTFSEQVLFHTHVIRSRGRVDHQDAFLDNQPIERERGITVFSEQAVFSIQGDTFYWIDTPGHADFSGEMERALQVIDVAVVLVSGTDGVQGHTETVFDLLQQRKIPCFFFLNKLDQEGADYYQCLQDIREKLTRDAIDFGSSFSCEGEMGKELIEELSERDDALLETYLEEGYQKELWLTAAREMIQDGRVFPCFGGSALQDQGVEEFLAAMHTLVQWRKEDHGNDKFCGRIYKIRHDRQGRRIVFLKVEQGLLRAKEEIIVPSGQEKVDELRIYQGEKFTTVQQVSAGDLCAVIGLSKVTPGDSVGARLFHQPSQLVPMMAVRVQAGKEVPVQALLSALRQLEEEDPLLGVEWNQQLEEIHISIMGTIQLEVLQQVLRERFGIEVSFGQCEIVYRETISSPVIGYGHFEPLRHYAEVHVRLEPGPRGSGITFSSECPTDVLEGNYQRLIRTHVMEKVHKGVLTGSPLTDVKVVLLTGRAHPKHTEGGDFREATYRAIRQGLMQASNILLEPYYRFRLTVPASQVGRVLSDIQRMRGVFEPLEQGESSVTVRGRGPVSQFLNYGRELSSFTGGKGSMSCQFDGYEPCEEAQEVIEAKGYEPERDRENSPDSIFCAKGAGYLVKWNQVESCVHCPKISIKN